MTDRRVVFDFEISFANGGGVSGRECRLDLPDGMGADGQVDERYVGDALVSNLRLQMVSGVRIVNARVVEEPHKPAGEASGQASGSGPASGSGQASGPAVGSIVELSHVIRNGEVTYPGLPAPVIGTHLSREASRGHYAAGTEFHIGTLAMVGNTGTYLDTPFHRYPGGFDLAGLPAASCVAVPGVVVAAPLHGAILPERLAGVETWGQAVLFHTGRDTDFGTPAYAVEPPYLTAETAAGLIEGGARLVGIDALNIDDVCDGTRPVQSALLAAGIPIVEHLANLGALPARGFEFTALPPLVADFGTFPVRAIARITA